MAIYLGTNKVSMSGLIEKPDDVYGFMKNSRLIATKTWSCKLSETDYSSYTPSTTSQNLKFPATAYTTTASTTVQCLRVGEDYDNGPVIDRDTYDYVCIGEVVIVIAYTTIPAAPYQIKYIGTRDHQYGKYHTVNNSTGLLNSTWSYNGTYLTSSTNSLFKTSTGYSTGSYGIKGATAYLTTFSSSNNKYYIPLVISGLSMQANASYMPVDAFSNINAANTTITATWKIYEGDLNVYSTIYQNTFNKIAIE